MNHLAVIGDPINHSLSPLMHNAALKDKNLSKFYDYKAIHIKTDSLDNFISSLDKEGITGFNVTLPHKIAIIKYLKRIDSTVEDIGAVNTVLKKDSKLIGYNTDVKGFLDSLDDNGIVYQNRRVLILGAGGTAQTIVYGLVKQGVSIEIYNRTESKALAIKKRFDKLGKISVINELETDDVELIINATSVGLNNHDSPIHSDLIKKKHTVMDIIYNPFLTPLLKQAKLKQCIYLNGLDMLVNQGAIAFKLFTGIEPDKTVMKDSLLAHFKNKNI